MKLAGHALVPVVLLAGLPLGCGNGAPGPVMGTAGAGAGGAANAGGAGASSGGAPVQAGAGPSGGGPLGGAAGQGGTATSTGGAGSSAGGMVGAAGTAGAAGAAGAAGTGACPGVCEDFELGQIDSAKWSTPVMGGATMTVQSTNAAHGKYAVQFHGPANPPANDYVYIVTKNAPTALAKHNFGRAYMYISPQRNDIDMGMIFGGTAGFPKPTYMSIANHSTGYQFGFIKLSGSPGGEVQAYRRVTCRS